MKFKWDTTFVKEDGETLMVYDEKGPTGINVTLDRLVTMALASTENDQRIAGDEKYKRYEIMKKVKAKAEVDVDEVALIKKCCGFSLTSPWLYGQVVDVLNQKEPALVAVEGGK